MNPLKDNTVMTLMSVLRTPIAVITTQIVVILLVVINVDVVLVLKVMVKNVLIRMNVSQDITSAQNILNGWFQTLFLWILKS